jgi:hypothetical protein
MLGDPECVGDLLLVGIVFARSLDLGDPPLDKEWQLPHRLPRALLRIDSVVFAAGQPAVRRGFLHAVGRGCPGPVERYAVKVRRGRLTATDNCYVYRSHLHPVSTPPGEHCSDLMMPIRAVAPCGLCLHDGGYGESRLCRCGRGKE